MQIRISLLAVLFTLSCQKAFTPQSGLFDTRAFFEAEALRLKVGHKTISKWLVYNGVSDSVFQQNNIEWDKELSLFSETDLGKPVYKKAFHVEVKTNFLNGKTKVYSAIDKKQAIKEVIISEDANNNVVSIEITSSISNMLYEGEKQLRYVCDSGFHIKEKQHLRNGEQATYEVKALFKP